MQLELLNKLIAYRTKPEASDDELAIIILKPGYRREHVQSLLSFIEEESLEILLERNQKLNKQEIIALYGDIYRFDKNDVKFGLSWKEQKMKYMSSGLSRIYILSGKNTQLLSSDFKRRLRENYGKLSIPPKKLTEEEFIEVAIKNIIHVVDDTEIEVAIWLLIE